MSRYHKISSYFFYTAILIAISLFIYDFIERHKVTKTFNGKSEITQKIVISNPEINALQERLQMQESEIVLLKNNIATINKQIANGERYSKFFFILSNLEKSLNEETTIDIAFQLKSLQNFAVNDSTLSKKINSINDITIIHGRKYFEDNFSRVVRKIMKKYYQDENEHYAIRYIKRHIMPYFAYLSPEGNHISYSLHQAHQKLEQGDMEKFYKLLLSLPTENEIYQDFMQKLEQYVRVESIVNFSKKHIETMLIEDSNIA